VFENAVGRGRRLSDGPALTILFLRVPLAPSRIGVHVAASSLAWMSQRQAKYEAFNRIQRGPSLLEVREVVSEALGGRYEPAEDWGCARRTGR
jgi:hypothetical protein